MKKLLPVLLATLCCSIFNIKGQEEKQLTDQDKIYGLSRLWEAVRSNYVFYDKLTFDWDSLYYASIPKVLETEDNNTYIRELQRLAATVGDGHTYVYDSRKNPRDRFTPAAFSTRFVEGKVLVDKVMNSSLLEDGIKKGIEVVSIDGIEVMEYFETYLKPYIHTSTPQWLYYRALEKFGLTGGKRNIPVTIGFKDGKKTFTKEIRRNLGWDIKEENSSDPTLNFTVIENNIGHLKLKRFDDDAIKEKFDDVYPGILTTDALIIDVRENGGGSTLNGLYILQHITEKPIKGSQWSSRMYIPAHASWFYPEEWFTQASKTYDPVKKEIYKKPVVVLTDAGTFSAAEDFTIMFKGMNRGKIIGMPTGGSTGNGVLVTLIEDVAMANICSKNDIGPDGTIFVGVGIQPDIEISETIESFISGNDKVLQKAIEEIANMN